MFWWIVFRRSHHECSEVGVRSSRPDGSHLRRGEPQSDRQTFIGVEEEHTTRPRGLASRATCAWHHKPPPVDVYKMACRPLLKVPDLGVDKVIAWSRDKECAVGVSEASLQMSVVGIPEPDIIWIYQQQRQSMTFLKESCLRQQRNLMLKTNLALVPLPPTLLNSQK